MACHRCIRTGVGTCDPSEAEIKCMICGFCEAEIKRKQREADHEEERNRNSSK